LRSAVCFQANEAQRAITADAQKHSATQRVSATKDDIQTFVEAIAPLSGQIPALHGPVQRRTEELRSDGIRVATWGSGLSSPVRDFKDFSRTVTTLSTDIASFCGPT